MSDPRAQRATWWWTGTYSLRGLPLVLALAALMVWTSARHAQPYWLDISSKASVGVLFLAPGSAALAALDAARLKPVMAGASRSPLSVLASVTVIHFAAAVLFITLMTGILAGKIGRPNFAPGDGLGVGMPHAGLLGLFVLTVTAGAALGFVLGRLLSAPIAAASAFAGMWLWLALPPSLNPYWVRNVNGNLGSSCCSQNLSLAPGALLAPALVAGSVLLACVLAMAIRRSWLGPLPFALIVLALVAGRSLVLDYGADPVQPRTDATACRTGVVQVCVWPELADSLPSVVADADFVLRSMRAQGIDLPSQLTMGVTQSSASIWALDLDPTDPAHRRAVIAAAPLAGLPPECVNAGNGRWPAGPAFEPVRAWLVTINAPTGQVPQEAREFAARVEALVPAQRQAWFKNVLAALQGCERTAPKPEEFR